MNQNPTARGRIVEMSKPIPTTEEGRTEEARDLVAIIAPDDYPKLTTWERQTIEDVKQGKAATKLRLREIREVIKRLQRK